MYPSEREMLEPLEKPKDQLFIDKWRELVVAEEVPFLRLSIIPSRFDNPTVRLMRIDAIQADKDNPGSFQLVCEERNQFNPLTERVVLDLNELIGSYKYENIEIITLEDPTNHQ